jgi:hypothetical protein
MHRPIRTSGATCNIVVNLTGRAIRTLAVCALGVSSSALGVGVLAFAASNAGAAPPPALPAASQAMQAKMDAAAMAAAQAQVGVSPDTIEPVDTVFAVTPYKGCGANSEYGDIYAAAVGKVQISYGTPCGVSVVVVADKSGTVVDGPVAATNSSTWAQSTVDYSSLIGEYVVVCTPNSCGNQQSFTYIS